MESTGKVISLKRFKKNTKQCDKCSGIGLVKNTTSKQCLCEDKQFCYKCENRNNHGLYKECETCWGTGNILIKINTKYK
jgi:DnaJ-class molecular chaperone